MAKIVLENVRKVYNGTVVAVDDMSLEIPDGEIVSLLGPSGCGKTTTMRLIAGFEDADEGKIYIDDQEVTTWPPNRRNFSMVFQFPVVYDTMTLYENIATPLRTLKTDESRIRAIVREVSSSFGIDEDSWHKKAAKLSISDRQRLSLAHAFAVERNLYILDEPFSNIDPKSRVRLTKYVRDIQQKKRHTLVFVTHSQSEALTLSDKIAVMKEGKLLQYDSPDAIYSKPANTFVGWFLGNPGMNFIHCSCRQKNGRLYLDGGAFVALDRIPAAYQKVITGERAIILGIRPEQVEISQTAKEAFIPCVCHFAEPLGSRLLLNVKLGQDVMMNVKVPLEAGVSVGDKVYVHLPEDRIMLFDDKTEEAL
ncbi:MAG: ABC transporter ATP-binding protein [Desulfobacterales bacterium]|nr:MAG: ABC transporter ATP-binding protein [Desulfobacterales bacterium]